MDNSLFYTGAFNQSIIISPNDLGNMINIDDLLLKKLRIEVEGKCIKHGFIKKNSVNIIKRTIGLLNSSQLNGSIKYDINFSAEVCNQSKGQRFKCLIKNINKLGLLAEINPIIIVIAKNNIKNNEFENIKINDEITIEIIGSRFDLYDTNISAIGKIV